MSVESSCSDVSEASQQVAARCGALSICIRAVIAVMVSEPVVIGRVLVSTLYLAPHSFIFSIAEKQP